MYLLFCVSRWGWGFDNYLAEVNTGSGLKMSRALKPYFQFVLPLLIAVILIVGMPSLTWKLGACAAILLLVFLMARRSKA